ncbi:MAG: exodeoxyribonuclease VII large subunit [Ruminococcus sp.]|nr:exodeoxyribonuclease VII large subunit [Ruminococcus sp.]
MTDPTFNKIKIRSVSQLNFYVKSLLEDDRILNSVMVTGEISNLTDHYRTGHIYFSLKDDKAVIRCVMFAGYARSLRFKPEEGMKVIAAGRVTLYEKTGEYQLNVMAMQPDGIGALTLAYEQLKKKLEEKGLFSSEHKKKVPEFPRTVGVITSPTGAVIRDIQNVISRRYPMAEILLCPVLVQGENAAPQLINAVNLFNEYDLADVIIIGRGGGSIEDLWAFNDKNLAYAIYASNIPVISAVGHETDFTICDFVSDLRAPTPSAAAELAVPDVAELRAYYRSQAQYIRSLFDTNLIKMKSRYDRYLSLLRSRGPEKTLRDCEHRLRTIGKEAKNIVNTRFITLSDSTKAAGAKLEALNPLAVLNRGYSIAEKNRKIVSSVKELNQGDLLKITFADGQAVAQIKEIKDN